MDQTTVSICKEIQAKKEVGVSRLARLMNIHRTSIYKKSRVVKMSTYRFYQRKDDEDILKEIIPIIESRPSYGYKRVTALVNKDRSSLGLPKLNKKRIYRLMKLKGYLLPKGEESRIREKKSGKVMTLRSNSRWCTDCFEIKCFNGEKVYVSFILDSCDREILSWLGKNTPILQEDIELLMIAAVEKRFKKLKTSHPIQFLSDRGAIYRSSVTQLMAGRLGLKSCFTRAYSPQSNGMAEAFVGRFKRDYVYVNDVETAEITIEQLEEWFTDYNENAPHSALGMKSPKEFRKQQMV